MANLAIRLISSQRDIHLDEDKLGHAQSQGAADLACNQFGEQRQRSLSCATEFEP